VQQNESNAMLKHPDDPRKEPARKVAERKWRNYDVERRFKEEAKKDGGQPKPPKELEPADVIEGEQDRRGSVTRAQTKFAKELREMMEGHANRNTVLYILSLQAKRKRLLFEKLRRLRAATGESK
jgi:hypothetical protein